jgi:hypothetical protein
MTASNGKEFSCYFPSAKEGGAQPPKVEKKEPVGRVVTKEMVVKGLAPLKRKCLTLHNGYWSYEVCPFNAIRQIHFEVNGVVGLDIKLGDYMPAQTEFNEELYTLKHVYQNSYGDRRVTVTFLCSPTGKNYLQDVIEDPIHTYRLNIFTPYICAQKLTGKKKELSVGQLLM